MIVNTVMDVNEALAYGLGSLSGHQAEALTTRNGTALRHVSPVTTCTLNPRRRVLFSPVRNANPFFHFMESLWMLSGRNDLPWLCQFNKRMAEYSDDGGLTQPAAYGHRWRNHFDADQIEFVISLLRQSPNSRRAVINHWDTDIDSERALFGGADVPCNTTIYFSVSTGRELDMTVCCRSNDLWWGAHGANAVHFSILLEYIAAACDLNVGRMYQVSNDYHGYVDVLPSDPADLALKIAADNRYAGDANETPLFTSLGDTENFDAALPLFMAVADPVENPVGDIWRAKDLGRTGSYVIDRIAYPMLRAWDRRNICIGTAINWAHQIGSSRNCDWRVACVEYLERVRRRRAAKKEKK